MRSLKKKKTAVLFLLILSLLPGCARKEYTKLVVLPPPAKEEKRTADRRDGYQVKKIYTREFEAPNVHATSVLNCGPHEMRIAQVTERGEEIRFDKMDYRYGFYETYGGTAGYRLAIYDWLAEDEIRFRKDALSPDGRYLLWLDQETTHIGPKVYLNNLETGEDTLLLDADVAGCPGDEYFPLIAWSRDGKYLSYCFFPKRAKIYNKERGKGPEIRILEVDTKTLVGQYAYNGGTEGDTLNLQQVEMYLDVADGKAMSVVAILRDPKWVDGTWVEVCTLGIEKDSNEENQCSFLSEGIETLSIYEPSVRDGKIYMGGGFDWIYYIDAETGKFGDGPVLGSYQEENAGVFDAGRVNAYLVLDGGETVFTTEIARLGEDICIYQKKGGIWERRILYQYTAGSLTYLQYDEENHRLLGVSSASYRFGAPQTAIVLEFE